MSQATTIVVGTIAVSALLSALLIGAFVAGLLS
jgi:hypothetical protein